MDMNNPSTRVSFFNCYRKWYKHSYSVNYYQKPTALHQLYKNLQKVINRFQISPLGNTSNVSKRTHTKRFKLLYRRIKCLFIIKKLRILVHLSHEEFLENIKYPENTGSYYHVKIIILYILFTCSFIIIRSVFRAEPFCLQFYQIRLKFSSKIIRKIQSIDQNKYGKTRAFH